ncbi:MAG: hypothetical protein DK306_001889 [Chloroflexi bacterium]|nr:MAG: hypothetical protein DK306_001889 [Chloroflexota bacterium]
MTANPDAAARRLKRTVQDPVRFARTFLGLDLWPTQEAILRSVAEHPRTAVKACHASSKTFTAAAALPWWITCFPDGVVITTAPTWHQVERVLWQQVRQMAQETTLVTYPIPRKTELRLDPSRYAIGLSTDEAVRFQGFHGHILVIIDEAPGVRSEIWEAIEGIRAGGDVHVLALGNPTDPSGPFADAWGVQAASWHAFTISAFDTPNLAGLGREDLLALEDDALDHNVRPYLVTRRWVREKWEEWGQHGSPLWEARVLGQFPVQTNEALYPLAWLEQAKIRVRPDAGTQPIEAGLDVAGPGEAETVVAIRQGSNLLALQAWPGADPIEAVVSFLAPWQRRITTVRVDEVGLGYHFALDLRKRGFPVEGVNVGKPARNPERFLNLKAEIAWGFRERLEKGDCTGLSDEQAIAQFAGLHYAHDARGRIVVESKESLRKRGLPSPDRVDAILLAFAGRSRTRLLTPTRPDPGAIFAGIWDKKF